MKLHPLRDFCVVHTRSSVRRRHSSLFFLPPSLSPSVPRELLIISLGWLVGWGAARGALSKAERKGRRMRVALISIHDCLMMPMLLLLPFLLELLLHTRTHTSSFPIGCSLSTHIVCKVQQSTLRNYRPVDFYSHPRKGSNSARVNCPPCVPQVKTGSASS